MGSRDIVVPGNSETKYTQDERRDSRITGFQERQNRSSQARSGSNYKSVLIFRSRADTRKSADLIVLYRFTRLAGKTVRGTARRDFPTRDIRNIGSASGPGRRGRAILAVRDRYRRELNTEEAWFSTVDRNLFALRRRRRFPCTSRAAA